MQMENFNFDIATRLKQIHASKKPLDKYDIVRRDAAAALNSKMSLYDVAETILALGSEDSDVIDCLERIQIGDILQSTPKTVAAKKPPTKPVQADLEVVDAILEAASSGPISQADIRELLSSVDEAHFRAAWNTAKLRLQKSGAGRATLWQVNEDVQKILDMKDKKAS